MVLKSSSDKVLIAPEEVVKVTKMNHIVEVQHMEKMNRKANIKKLDADTYLEISTGEIKEFNHSENRQQNYNSLRQTFKKMRYLINNNFTGKGNELHITLTYKENVTDTSQLYKDFKRFMTRLKRKAEKKTTVDYMSIVEPQGRGAWHCHVLMRFNDMDKVFIKNSEIRQMWGNGFVKIKALKGVDNIGAYLSAYLTDIEVDDQCEKEAQVKIVDGEEKKFLKGGRLHMYPPGMNLYRKSKGIVEPERVEMRFKDIKKVVGAATPHYQKSITIKDEDYENTISYIQYNTKR
jgi:hypothetical protein